MKHTREGSGGGPDPSLSAGLDELGAAASEVGWQMPDGVPDKLVHWAELVIAWRMRAGLTAAATTEAVLHQLMVPAIYALPFVVRAGSPTVLDLGCGSGCTGVTLASVVARGRWSLVDRAERKITFCRYALKRCGIPGVQAYTRTQALAGKLRADIVLARALPRTGASVQDIGRFAAPGASLVRWLTDPPEAPRGEIMRCGSRGVWISVDPVESFT